MNFLKASHGRTVFLAIVAACTFVAAAIFMFDVDVGEMLHFFIACLLGLVLIIAAALLLTAIRILLQKWLG